MHLPSTLKRITYKTAPYITTLHAKLIYQVMLVSSFSPPLDRISFQCIWSQLILLKSSSDLSLARYYSATINSFKSLPRFLVPVTSTSPYHPKISFIPSMHFYDDFFTHHIIPSSVFTLASHSSYSTPIMLLYSFYLLPYLNWGNFGLSLTSIYYKFGKDLFHPSLYSLNKYFLQSAKLSVHQQFFSLARFYSWVSHFLLPFLQVCIPNYLNSLAVSISSKSRLTPHCYILSLLKQKPDLTLHSMPLKGLNLPHNLVLQKPATFILYIQINHTNLYPLSNATAGTSLIQGYNCSRGKTGVSRPNPADRV